MMSVTLYHNSRCSTSRATLQLLVEHGHNPLIIDYLRHPPEAATLQQLLVMLGFNSARQLMRKKESLYKSLQLDETTLTEQQLLSSMVNHPILIERPIVVFGTKAVIGRPPEQVLRLFSAA